MTKIENMQLSVIIPTYNRKKILTETLDAIYPMIILNRDKIEIIVVNDGDDVLTDIIDKYKNISLKIVDSKKKRSSVARNVGAMHAKGEILLFHDDDIIPKNAEYFSRHVELSIKFPNAIITANLFYPEHLIAHVQKTSFGRYKLLYEYQGLSPDSIIRKIENGLYEANSLAGFSCCMRKKTWEILGGFNEQFEYAGCEDAEFSYRARKNEFILLFDESNICYHNELDKFELRKWLWRQSTGIKSAVVMCQLHPEGKSHPTWYTNTPISLNDTLPVKFIKIKKWILSQKVIIQILFAIVKVLERLHFSDKILFRLYNALWLGHTYRSFNEAYKKLSS